MVDTGVERDYLPLASGPSAAGAAVQVNVPARAGCRVQIGFCHISYSAAPAAGAGIKMDDGTNKFDLDLTAAGVQLLSLPGDGLTFEAGQAVKVTLAGGGAAVIAKISLGYRYIRHR